MLRKPFIDIYILDTLITAFHCNAKISKSTIIKNVMEEAQKDEGYTHCRYNTKWELFTQ